MPKLLSVIIPTCNRPEHLAACLERLVPEAQSYSAEFFEVIVTDDSADTTAREVIRQRFPRVRWVAGPRRGPAANRNNGAKHASHDYLVFVDDDCLPSRRWLACVAEAFERGAEIVEGKTVCPDGIDSPFQEQIENRNGGVLWSCNLAVTKQRFYALGGFDEDFLEAGGEDMEFAWRVQRAGLKPVFEPRALVEHPGRRVGWRQLVRRLGMIRWMLLYRHKTGEALPLDRSAAAALLDVTCFHVVGCARLGWNFLRDFPGTRWRSQLFEFVWKGMTLPVVLPYLMFWELQFRNQLARRAPATKPVFCH